MSSIATHSLSRRIPGNRPGLRLGVMPIGAAGRMRRCTAEEFTRVRATRQAARQAFARAYAVDLTEIPDAAVGTK